MTEHWSRFLRLVHEPFYRDMINNVYHQNNFTLMYRHYLDESLAANKEWFTLDNVDNETMESCSRELVNKAVSLIQEKARQEEIDITYNQMIDCINAISMLEPVHLVKIVQRCLHSEYAILEHYDRNQRKANGQAELSSSENNADHMSSYASPMSTADLNQLLIEFEDFLKDQDKNSINVSNDLNELNGRFNDRNEIARNLQFLVKNMINNNAIGENYCNSQLEECKSAIKDLEEKVNDQLLKLETNLRHLNDHVESILLPHYEAAKMEREDRVRANANGIFQDVGVIVLEEMAHRTCSALLKIITIITRVLRHSIRMGDLKEKFEMMKCKSKMLLQRLVMQCLMVEMQPPQVIKTNAKFRSSVRLAVGEALHLQRQAPKVKVTLVNEEQLRRLTQDTANINSSSAGHLTGNEGNLEFSQSGLHALVALLGSIKLCKILRSPDRRGISLEEKFCLIFCSEFTVQIGDEQLKMLAWTSSLPLVVVVHDLQKTQAEGPILWDNAFHLPNRSGFEVFQEVSWEKLAVHLQHKFIQMTHSCDRRVGLTQKQLAYLKQKLFSTLSASSPSTSYGGEQLVTYEMFLRKNFSNDRPFTFWEWFWQAVKAIKEDMREEWNDGLICGFMDKAEVEQLLISCCVPHTFLIRFVDSQPGLVCCHCLVFKPDNSSLYVCHPRPYSRGELSQRALSLRIREATMLEHLFIGSSMSSLDKKTAFEKHWLRESEKDKKKNPTLSGYCERQQLEKVSMAEEIFNSFYLNDPNARINDQDILMKIDSMGDLFNHDVGTSPYSEEDISLLDEIEWMKM